MPSPIRIDIPNVVYEETFRCRQGRFLLLPEEELNDLILGAIGRGLHLFPNVRLHDFNHLSNHGHRLISSTDGVSRAAFSQYVNQRISFEAGRRYGWDGGIFHRPTRPIPIITNDDQLDRFRYLRSHGVKEGLVASADEWPGASALPFLRNGKQLEGTFVWRDDETKARRRAKVPIDPTKFRERYAVVLTKLPALEHLSWEEIHRFTDDLTKAIETTCAAERTSPVLGRDAVLAQHPHGRPAKSKKSPAPIVHCRDKNLKARFRRLARHLTNALRIANRERRQGRRGVVFPPFCHPARLPYVSWEAAMGVDSSRLGEEETCSRHGPDGQARANSPPSLLELLEGDVPFLLA